MKHIRPISVAKASDAFGSIFLQVWLNAFLFLLSGVFNEAKDK